MVYDLRSEERASSSSAGWLGECCRGTEWSVVEEGGKDPGEVGRTLQSSESTRFNNRF